MASKNFQEELWMTITRVGPRRSEGSKEMDVQFAIVVVGYNNNTRLIRERKGKTKNHGHFRRGSKF
jgi:hypothetical protein